MLRIYPSKIRRLFSRIPWLLRKLRRPKVVMKRFGKMDWRAWRKKGLETNSPKVHLRSNSGRPIRVATFNVALFSLAAAARTTEESALLTGGKGGNQISTPKSILKQSPLHSSTSKKPRVCINLPDNEISLAYSYKFLSLVEGENAGGENAGSNLMRSPVHLPSSIMSWWDHESLNNIACRRCVAELLKELDADVFALQDVKAEEAKNMRPLSDLAAALEMEYVFAESWAPEYGNAILSKWPITKCRVQRIVDDDDFRNVLRATIDVPWAGEVNFYCTQLDHLDENWRRKQIDAIIQANDSSHILLGGLNSLDESDYSSYRWKQIVKYYEDIGKPTPRVEVMRLLKERGYSDAKEFAGECEPVVIIAKGQNVQGTCKYGTRVDYILASPDSPYKFVPQSYSVVSSEGTSDHHIVKVDIVKTRVDNPQEKSVKWHQKAKERVIRITYPLASRGMWKTYTRHIDS